jgi:hypothetical protein
MIFEIEAAGGRGYFICGHMMVVAFCGFRRLFEDGSGGRECGLKCEYGTYSGFEMCPRSSQFLVEGIKEQLKQVSTVEGLKTVREHVACE